MNVRTWLTLTAALLVAFLSACTPAELPADVPETPRDHPAVVVPEGVLQARDAALSHVARTNDFPELTGRTDWSVADITQPDILGQGAYQFLSGDWMVAVSYPVVAPENVRYTVEIVHTASEFVWKGTVLPDGSIAESTEPHPDATFLDDRWEARNAALAYVINRYIPSGDSRAEPAEMVWAEIWSGSLFGYMTSRYTCEHWEVEVEEPVVAVEDSVFIVRLISLDYGFSWEGTVDAFGRIIERQPPLPVSDGTGSGLNGQPGNASAMDVGLSPATMRFTLPPASSLAVSWQARPGFLQVRGA